MVFEHYNTSDPFANSVYPTVLSSDNVGIVKEEFFPPEGEIISMRKELIVQYTATDDAGNEASCFFTFVALRKNLF